MLPRKILLGDILHISRRCEGRLSRLRASPETNSIVAYCLARAARRHGIEVIAFVIMSNHLHIIIRDARRTRPFFCQEAFSNIARALNFAQETGGVVFSQGSYREQVLATPHVIYQKIAYVMANPVAASCVRTPEQWPGLITLPKDLGKKTFTAARPAFFRDPEEKEGALTGDETARDLHRLNHSGTEEERDQDPMRDTESLTLVLPPVLPDGTSSDGRGEDVRREAGTWLALELEQVHEERRREGLRGWVGAQKVRRQDPKQPPRAVNGKPTGELNPRFAALDRQIAKELAAETRGWLQLHAAARREWSKGVRTVVFPVGTWLAPLLWGAKAHPA